ncbi:hypothetical protein Hanom_Chr11g00983041 [Helianthus anomalus]
MTRIGDLLRNFRRKVYAGYIVPNLGKPKKLARIPKRYRSMVEQTDWDKFVTYTQSDKCKVLIFYSNVYHNFILNIILNSYEIITNFVVTMCQIRKKEHD